jgi:hypothetical protein
MDSVTSIKNPSNASPQSSLYVSSYALEVRNVMYMAMNTIVYASITF